MNAIARSGITEGESDRRSARARGAGDAVAVPEDGGAHRDLRAATHEVNEDAQLTARLPPPSVLALDRTVTGRNLWFLAEQRRALEPDPGEGRS